VKRFIDRLNRCGNPKIISTWRGVREIRVGCKHPLCPYCTGWLSGKEGKKAWGKLSAKAGNVERNALSWITINWVVLPMGSDFKPASEDLRDKFRNLLERHFPKALFYGGFHIALTEDGMGKLHLHGWLYQEGVEPEEVIRVMARAFPEPDQLEIRGMRKGRTVDWHFKRSARYAADNDLLIDGRGSQTLKLLHDWVLSMELLRGHGRKGLRFEYGLRVIKRNPKNAPSVVNVPLTSVTEVDVQVIEDRLEGIEMMKVVLNGDDIIKTIKERVPWSSG